MKGRGTTLISEARREQGAIAICSCFRKKNNVRCLSANGFGELSLTERKGEGSREDSGCQSGRWAILVSREYLETMMSVEAFVLEPAAFVTVTLTR